ncbi:MAG: type IV toxin-antitoxin system AbiEi family antitoxin domain-containing protein, partial [Ilumatobacteraceae bacterium]
MTTLPKDVLHWIAGYHGTVTSVALRERGISAFQQRRLVQDGTLIRMINGSYRFAGAPSNHHDRYVSACSHASELVICGPSAGLLWNLRRMPRDGLVHVIAPPHSNPTTAPWLKPYRTALLDPRHVVHRLDGIRLTAPPRTAVDLSRHLNGTDLRSIIDQLVHRGTCTPETMRDVALSLDTPGRPWARRFLDVLDKRPAGPPTESHGES